MPLQATSGAASYDAFGGGVAAVPNYIEDVFSTWLIKPPADFTNYSINNGIDLLGKGGMTWFKARDAAQNNIVYDTARGSSSGNANALITNGTQAQQTSFWDFVTPNSNGFTVNFASGGGQLTNGGINYASWTFRKQPKFFDVVTYTGDGAFTQLINHNLGSVPGAMFIKRTDSTSDWFVYHRSVGNDKRLLLNTTAASASSSFLQFETPTSTQFTVGFESGVNGVNVNGATYVAYLFAHNAGGFGLTGTDNVISCGSYTGTGAAGNAITLGYEPQWILAKASSFAQSWQMFDVMRGMPVGSSNDSALYPNLSNAEAVNEDGFSPTATGFVTDGSNNNLNGVGYIYIAIRRGPMKVPTTGTSVFDPDVLAFQAAGTQVTTNFPVDMTIWKNRDGSNGQVQDRLRGFPNTDGNGAPTLFTNSTAAEDANQYNAYQFWNTGFRAGSGSADRNQVWWSFRRAPGFFDEVCYTGNGTSGRALNHNLGVTPEMLIVKSRYIDGVNEKAFAMRGTGLVNNQTCFMNSTAAQTDAFDVWGAGAIGTASVFYVGADAASNTSGGTYVAYLFASCPGVSKVGNYTGTGATQVVDCGFTGGARFVLVKSLSASGAWYVWDSARGIVAGDDPYLLLNSTAAEVTNTDWVDTAATGFELSNAGGNLANSSGVSYIFLAIS
jgi:hypothetical protein